MSNEPINFVSPKERLFKLKAMAENLLNEIKVALNGDTKLRHIVMHLEGKTTFSLDRKINNIKDKRDGVEHNFSIHMRPEMFNEMWRIEYRDQVELLDLQMDIIDEALKDLSEA